MTTAEPALRAPAGATEEPGPAPAPADAPSGAAVRRGDRRGDRATGGDPRQRALRDVLGRYATGVVVVTTSWADRPAGVTVNSFTSVSLDPPLVLWCLRSASGSRESFTSAAYFAVNILAAGQLPVAVRFTGPGDRFAGLPTVAGPHGLPLLPGTAGTLVCRRERILAAGDHLLLMGEVLDHRATPGPALLFADGAYHRGPDDLS